ncbi:MAG: GHKL domain-containing protein [Lachnospiraceae bacterium]
MLRIGICDDEFAEVERQSTQVEQVMSYLGLRAEIVKCLSGEDILSEMGEGRKFDFLMLDIEMQQMDGIETAQKVREQDYNVVLIFVSAHDSHCKRAIGVQPFAFLDKPLDTKELLEVFQKALQRQSRDKRSYRFQWNKVFYQVDLQEILYFSSEKRVIKVVMKDKEYRFYGILDQVEQEIQNETEMFLRIHKSWLVNAGYIREYHYEKVVLEGGEELTISKRNRETVRKWYLGQAEMGRESSQKDREDGYAKQFAELEEIWKELRIFRHDAKQRYLLEQAYLKQGEYDKLQSCYEESLEILSCKKSATGNPYLDIIISHKEKAAESKKISFYKDLCAPYDFNINEKDIYVILGNLLDNAIEAVEQIEEVENRKVRLKMKTSDRNLFISVENPYENSMRPPVKRTGDHGIGLKIVRNIVEKYHGEMHIEGCNGWFQVKILLYEADIL